MTLTTGIFDSNDPRKNELFLLGEMAERLVLFYDSIQAIRPSDIPYRDFQDYIQEKGMERRMLTRQFRVRIQDKNATYTADDYINGICSFLQIKQDAFDPCVFQNPSKDAYFGVVDSIHTTPTDVSGNSRGPFSDERFCGRSADRFGGDPRRISVNCEGMCQADGLGFFIPKF